MVFHTAYYGIAYTASNSSSSASQVLVLGMPEAMPSQDQDSAEHSSQDQWVSTKKSLDPVLQKKCLMSVQVKENELTV